MITGADLIALLPFLILGGAPVVVMLAIAVHRHHGLTLGLTAGFLTAAFLALPGVLSRLPRQATPLIAADSYAFFYTGLILLASLVVALLSYGHLEKRQVVREELYILLLLAALGAAVLAAASHFVSFFLGLEILSVSLYPLIAYERRSGRGAEAGIKYLILAAASASFLIFGMALVYSRYGTMEFSRIGGAFAAPGGAGIVAVAGLAMIVVGIGFKLGMAPFHMWTPDIFEGAPPPVAGFIATVSKGAMFALLLRYFSQVPITAPVLAIFTVIAIGSMFVGNLLALFQQNVKRILAYSSIAHLGYLLVAFLASGPLRPMAVTFYLTAYFVTTLGAFGVVTVLSGRVRDADELEDYRGLSRRSPWLTGVFTAMLLSLAGMPLTAGFIGKFYLVAAGAGSSLWLLVIVLLVNSTIGLFYYLRLIAVLFAAPPEAEAALPPAAPAVSPLGHLLLGVLLGLLLWLGILPAPLIDFIHLMIPAG
ncbi:MAG: NADH-quinone oxidoreductase subunit N [Desulfobacteraceae bacterium]|nr:NADH-quinone oxidoreductase subunit N [Desulfobacteraceae bacterium]